MVRNLRKSGALALAMIIMTVVCAPHPAMAQQPVDYRPPTSGNVQQGGGEMGRSMGGAAGMAVGAIGGSALGAFVVKAAAVAALGPLAKTMILVSIVAGSAFLGSKMLSTLGQGMERSMGTKNFWTMMGATLGCIAAIGLLGSAGIFAGTSGLILKGVIGGLAGGTIGRLFSGKLEFIANPRILYPALGGVIAAVGGLGFGGAIAGVGLGYVIGSIMDSVYFADRARSLSSYGNQAGYHAESVFDRLKGWTMNVKNWVAGATGGTRNWLQRNWQDDNPYGNQYYDYAYNQGYQSNNDYGYQQDPYQVNYNSSYGNQGNLSGYQGDYNQAYNNFTNLNSSGASIEQRKAALEDLRRKQLDYNSQRSGYLGY